MRIAEIVSLNFLFYEFVESPVSDAKNKIDLIHVLVSSTEQRE